ncbi:helix-turn-helix domain-containing protein [Paenibacillus sp. FSL P4-0338]|uniref:PucR family transcriptional regulator n=1 Tax=unclassified Paenibacillus TaxID=185978 RepID=UPI0003E24A05|nr:helix-turn-helix domain-containing protein [Paenibacillus sp. FSL R7-269]ETT55094.1 PucR family transcriptional regulator [Paenibacillus sp. FSL R7-269]
MTEAEPSFDRFFDSMESLADTLSESLQAQVTIEDSNHHVIGYSSHQFESDAARISTIIGKRVPNTVIIGLRKKGVMHNLENTGHPIRIPAVMEVGLGPRLAMCIRHQQEILGYIWVVDGGNLTEGHAERIVEKAAGIAGRYLLKQRGWKTRQEKTFEDFFWKLLTSHYESELRIRQEAEAGTILLPERYYIGVLESSRPVDEHFLQKFRRVMDTYSGQRLLFQTAEQNRLIILFSFIFPVEGTGRLSSFLHKLLGELGQSEGGRLTAGCSPEYREYTSAAEAYREALQILEMKKRLPYHTRELLLYEEIGFWAYLPAILEQKRNRPRRSALLYPLKEHDREHKSDFLKTLAVYLSLNGNLKESAAFLHIHTNTLMYRLNRIAEITGRSLKETDYRTSIYLDLLTEETAQVNLWFQEAEGSKE